MQLLFLFVTLIFSGLGIISNAQPSWSVDSHAYEFSMTITGKVTIDDQFSTDKEDKIAVFAGGECRGVTNIQFDPGINGYFAYLMVYGNKMGESLAFYVYDASRNKIIGVQNSLSFSVNSIVGSPDDPYLFKAITLSPAACLVKPDLRIYPNPFGNELFIGVPEGKRAIRISLYSNQGQLLKSLTWNSGTACRLNTEKMTPGFYFITLDDGHGVQTKKLVRN